jgi:hypothetical protein
MFHMEQLQHRREIVMDVRIKYAECGGANIAFVFYKEHNQTEEWCKPFDNEEDAREFALQLIEGK